MCTSFGVIYQNTVVIIILVGFQKDIAHITVALLLSKTGTQLDKEGVSGALLNDLPKSLECILLDLFNAKLHAHSSDAQLGGGRQEGGGFPCPF